MRLLVIVAAALALAPAAAASTIWFASEHVSTPILGVQLGIDGHGAKTITWGPILARSAQGAVATADGHTLKVDGNAVATVGWPVDDAAFSPDGRTVAFTDLSEAKCDPTATGCATWELWLVHTDGSGLEELTADGKYPRFSPDGRKLAFVGGYSAYDSYGTAVVQDLATGKRTWFTAASDAAPVWAPDSNRIAYGAGRLRIASVRPRRVRTLGLGYPEAFSPDGRRLLYATRNALYAGSTRLAAGSWFDASWSPGGWIVYAAESSRTPLDYALYRVRPDGTHRAVLRTFPPTTYLSRLQAGARTIVFQEEQSRQGLAVLDTVDPDAGDLRRVRVEPTALASPAVSPSGTLAFMRATRPENLYPCIVLGSRCVTTPRTADGAREPVWSPGGGRLAYLDYPRAGERDLVVLDAKKGTSRVVRRFGGFVQSPTWSPDGTSIAVASSDGAADHHLHLFSVEVATGAATELATGETGMAAAFNPNDTPLAFVGGPWGGPYELELYDTQTGAITDLGVPAAITRPAWSPGGDELAYQAPDGSIHVIRSDGTNDREVAPDALPGSPLAWSR